MASRNTRDHQERTAGPNSPPNPRDDEFRVLTFLAADDEMAFGFDTIGSDTGLSRKQVRAACRALAARGLARYYRGLMTEDGEAAGSGYGVTIAGVQFHWSRRSGETEPGPANLDLFREVRP